MRVAEVIRNILDVLDAIDQYDKEQEEASAANSAVSVPQDTEAAARLSQISDLLDKEQSSVANRPNEQYAGIDAVTASGTDVNKSKHPSDIRASSPSLYPGYQNNPGENNVS